MQLMYKFLPPVFVVIACVLIVPKMVCSADTADTAANKTVTTAPTATRPAEEIVLIRFGDADTLMQAEFEKNARGYPPDRHNNVISSLTRDKLFLLYLHDHPELVPTAVMEEAIDQAVFENKAKSREELELKLHQRGLTWQDMQERLLIGKGLAAVIRQGEKHGRDEAYMRKRYEANPDEFNGTTVSARHIQITLYPYDTPQQREAKRARLAKIREDLVSGKIKWDRAVNESECRTKLLGGNLGNFSRHIMITEPVAGAAFNMEVGQLSEIVESDLGFHIIEVFARKPGNRPFEHHDTQKDLRLWLEFEPLQLALREARKKYPLEGVQAPLPPAPLPKVAAATAPAAPTTNPARPKSKMRFPDMPTRKSPKTRPAKPPAVETKPAK